MNKLIDDTASIMRFKRLAGITEAEEAEFKTTNLDQLQTFLRGMQGAQEQSNQGLQNMNRLHCFLTSAIQYITVTGDFVRLSDFENFIWVSLPTHFHMENSPIDEITKGPAKYVLKVSDIRSIAVTEQKLIPLLGLR